MSKLEDIQWEPTPVPPDRILKVLPRRVLERVPVLRIGKKLGWKTKLSIGLRRAPWGILLGAGVGLLEGLANGATFGLPLIARALVYGISGGAAVLGKKVYSETKKDKDLNEYREIMNNLEELTDGHDLEVVENALKTVVTLVRFIGYDPTEALQRVAVVLGATTMLSNEITEFLTVCSMVLKKEDPAGPYLDLGEILQVIKEAVDIHHAILLLSDAYKRKLPEEE